MQKAIIAICIILLFITTSFASPYITADCSDNTDYLMVNGLRYDCPLKFDVGNFLVGITTIEVLPVGVIEGDWFIFEVEKSENRKFEFYNMIYDRSQKEYFNKFGTSIKIKK